MIKMNWTEKYRPNVIGDLIGQHKFVADAKTWVTKGDLPNTLLYGVPGIGKTSAAHVLANHFLGEHKDTDFLEINASQDRKLETVRQTITNFVNTRSVSGNKFKICFLDELEGMTRDSQRALKRVMERAVNVRFVIACNDPYAVDDAIRSRCANYFFTPIPVTIQVERLMNIITENNAEFSEENAHKIVDICGGDMRRAINELQACIYSGKTPDNLLNEHMGPYKNCLKQLLNKDPDALDFLQRLVFAGHTVKDICGKLLQCVLDMELSATEKFKVVGAVGEMEWRSRSVTPKVLVAWFTAQFMK